MLLPATQGSGWMDGAGIDPQEVKSKRSELFFPLWLCLFFNLKAVLVFFADFFVYLFGLFFFFLPWEIEDTS